MSEEAHKIPIVLYYHSVNLKEFNDQSDQLYQRLLQTQC